MINSSLLQTDSDKRLRSSLTRTTKTDLLTIPPTDKLDDINNNHYDEHENNANDCTKADLVLNDNENDATLLTTTTTTTVEVKVKTTKTSSRKRKLNAVNDMNSDNIHKQQQPVTKKKKNLRVTKPDERTSNKKANFQTVDQSSTTDESSFGSCEPGTNVVLQGIVWNETDKGVLVVNITWRGKTYVGALLNTTEQNWAPPRYKSDVRSTKQNHNRDQQLTSLPSSQDSTERILRNGKRRGSSTTTTVTPSSTTKNHSFKIPPTPPPTLKADDASTIIEKFVAPSSINMNDEDETNSINEEKRHRAISNGGGGDDEIGDNYSSRSISPTTSGTSTTSSSPPLLNNTETQSSSGSIPMDLSHSTTVRNVEEKINDNLLPYHFPNDIVNSSAYFSSLHGSTNAFSLPSFNKLSSQSPTLSSSSSYLSMPPQLYFNALTLPHYPSVSSLSKSSR